MSAVEWSILPGLSPYRETLEAMENRVAAIRAGEAAEAIWLLEHPRSTPPAPRPGPRIWSSPSAFPSMWPVAADNIPTTGRGSGWPMSCSISTGAAGTCAAS